ncbi:MAG: hypothetical protein EOO06_18130 [Chitinophagaceae bacterium]|nr:MAG: hypothetical protein EOO06_18130 [Chitinophagaceae bacterium]
MNYLKEPASIADQITTLKARGLSICDDKKAASYLSNISYYRYLASVPLFADHLMPFKSARIVSGV